MRKALIPLMIVASAAGAGALLAQPDGPLDLAAIQARAAEHSDDALALTEEVLRRAEEQKETALEASEAGQAQLAALEPSKLPAGPSGAFDFDEIVSASAASMAKTQATAPQFMVFVSFSMPEAALRRLIVQTSAAGGFVVFRGFPNNSTKQFVAALSKVVTKDDQFANIGVDPRLFRAFDIQAVPSFVAVSSDFELCDGLSCRTTPPPYDLIAGNVSTGYALATFISDNGPGTPAARAALANLEGIK